MTIYLLENEKEEWWILPTEDQEVINANITLGIDITSYKGEIDESKQELSQNQIVHQVPQAPVIYPDLNEGNSEFEKFINNKESWELK